MSTTQSLLLVGGGKMGGALMAGWIGRGIPAANIFVVEPNSENAAALARSHGVTAVSSPDDLGADFAPGLVMFAVKPQVMEAVVPPYRRFAGPDTVFLSIAAGTPVSFFEGHLGEDAAVVRAMPNTPAAVGRGVSVACANAKASDAQRTLCHDLLTAVGQVHWVDDEEMIHAVTGVSGSGPAYVFHFVECLARAGRDAGLPGDLADALARATVEGAGELLHQASADSPRTLRQNVTSPGGTTAAGLSVLMGGDPAKDDPAQGPMGDIVTECVAAAAMRSRELAG
ncbi:MAG: pyrroline-5-carboxylate reductase [Rhodospirillales bacterium]